MKHVPLWTFAQTAGLATVLIIRKKKVNTMHHNSQYETELDPERERERREGGKERKRERHTERLTD